MNIPAVQRERSIDGVSRWVRGAAVAVILVVLAAGCHAPDRSGAGAVFCRLQPSGAAHLSRRVVDIEGDARPSWVTPVGTSLAFETEVPEDAELRFACAVDPESAQPVTFRMQVSADDAERHQLWEWTSVPVADPAGRTWHEAAVALASSAGRVVRLELEAVYGEVEGVGTGTVAWAVPRLVVAASGEPRPNIVLVVIDTLRADHMSLYGYERQTTPGIDSWARDRGVVFSNVVAQAPWTLPSHVSLFTGLDPLNHGLNHKERVPEGITTIAEILGDAGYATKAITGGAYLGPGSGLMQGFDSLEHWFLGDEDREQRANDIAYNTDRALQWLERCDERPFFLFFHTYEVHAPYRAREPFFSRFHGAEPQGADLMASVSLIPPEPESGFVERYKLTRVFRRADGTPVFRAVTGDDLGLVRDLYDAGVAFADAHVVRLLQRLGEPGLERHTAVILTSDHGESLGENGSVGHCSLEEAELMVPLVVALPDGAHHGKSVGTQVRLMDVAPTVLELAGVAPAPDLDGRSLLALLTGRNTAFPVQAWSYAASSNHGVALRVANRLRYSYNNSALPPLQGREDLLMLGEERGERGERELAQLRGQVWSALETRVAGVRVQLSSRGLHPLQCGFKGALVEPTRVKGVGLPEGSVRWVDGSLEITVEPQREVTVWLEGRAVGRLGLTANAGAVTLEHILEMERLDGVWRAVVAGSAWVVEPEDGDRGLTEIRVWRHRSRMDDSTSPAEFDREVREQLRQLGYLQ